MLYLSNVTKIYPDESQSLDNVSLTVAPGEFVAIMGHSGSGKTTIMKLILGDETPTTGSVYYESLDIGAMSRKDLMNLRRRIGTIFQDLKLLRGLNVYENIAFAMEVSHHTDSEIEEYVPHVLDLVGLTHKAYAFPETLSGGEKQRLAIGRAIIHQPELILADEPTASLDPLSAHDVMKVLHKISELGTAVLMTTHTPELAEKYAGRVITIDKGKIVRDDTLRPTKKHTSHYKHPSHKTH